MAEFGTGLVLPLALALVGYYLEIKVIPRFKGFASGPARYRFWNGKPSDPLDLPQLAQQIQNRRSGHVDTLQAGEWHESTGLPLALALAGIGVAIAVGSWLIVAVDLVLLGIVLWQFWNYQAAAPGDIGSLQSAVKFSSIAGVLALLMAAISAVAS